MMHTLIVNLKQHTPLIHFQPEYADEGASLRATEVKPKLDRFIIQKMKEQNKDYKQWLLKKAQNEALDYKIKISTSDCKEWSMENEKGNSIVPFFFANMNQTDHKKKMIFTLSPIKMEFFSIHDSLISEIKGGGIINEFFATNNFGTRQSKGFGSFYPIPDNNNKHYPSPEEISTFPYYQFTININGNLNNWNDGFKNLFTILENFYKTLRSGINLYPFYFKSLMFFYARDNEEYYDKKKIRDYFQFYTDNNTHEAGPTFKEKDKGYSYELPYSNKNKARLYRDMLGLSTDQTWGKYNAKVTKTDPKSDNERTKNEAITRFKSPITLKPIKIENSENVNKFIILVIPHKIPSIFYDRVFFIKASKEKEKKFKGNNENGFFPIKTPEKFDIKDYIKYVLDGKGKEEAIKQLRDQKKYIEINKKKIIEELKKEELKRKSSNDNKDNKIDRKIDGKINGIINKIEQLINIYEQEIHCTDTGACN